MVRAVVSGLSIQIREMRVRILPVASATVAQLAERYAGRVPLPEPPLTTE